MAHSPWQPDPEKVAARLEAVREALRKAREAGSPAYVLERYGEEIRRIERLLVEPQPEPRCLDDLSNRAIIHALTKGVDSQIAPSGAKRTLLSDLTGLPVSLPNVPSGLPEDETKRLEAAASVEMFSEWAETLAGRWKLHEPRHEKALACVADRWECSPAEAKLRLAWVGLLVAMASAGDPWSGRIGSGKGSGKVDAVPKEAGVIGQLKWLSQEALGCAMRALEDEDERVSRPEREVAWPSDPETGEALDRPSQVLVTRGEQVVYEPCHHAEEAIVAADSARERLADIYEAARGKEPEKLEALLLYLRSGCDFTEARRRAAEDLGVNENAIDLTLSRLRKRLGP